MASTEYNRGTSFTDAQAAAPSAPLSGPGVDAEFDRVKIALDSTQQNLALIQRDDGALANGSVGIAQIQPEVYTGLSPVSKWTAGVSYKVNQTTFFDNGTALKLYRCLIAHVGAIFSNDLAAGRWLEIADYTPPATVGTVSIASGGTGATDAAGARANLGLGTLATQNTVPVTQGGTGATDAAGARAALNVQQADATLAGLAALAPGANEAIYATGADAFGVYPTTTFSRNLMGAGSAASFVAGLGIASQAEAQAGTDNTKLMTPLRVADAIRATTGVRWLLVTGPTGAGTTASPHLYPIPASATEVRVLLSDVLNGGGATRLVLRLKQNGVVNAIGGSTMKVKGAAASLESMATGWVIGDAEMDGTIDIHILRGSPNDIALVKGTTFTDDTTGTTVQTGAGTLRGANAITDLAISSNAGSASIHLVYVR